MTPLPTLEDVFGRFRWQSGLYVVGAGASAGDVDVGTRFMAYPGVRWLQTLSGFSASVTDKLPLTRSVIRLAGDAPLSEIFPGREIRPGTDTFPTKEILLRLPDYYTRAMMQHVLAAPVHHNRRSDSYRVFRLFHPATVANYNHDGMLAHATGRRHHIVNMHGIVDPQYGSPEMAELIERLGEYDGLPVPPDGLLMCVPEENDRVLVDRLVQATSGSPPFIAIVGYSFAKNELSYDDNLSLEFFRERFRDYRGKVFVFEPNPNNLQNMTAMLSDTLRTKNVIGVCAFWNVLAHAYLRTIYAPKGRSINWTYQKLLDDNRGPRSFP